MYTDGIGGGSSFTSTAVGLGAAQAYAFNLRGTILRSIISPSPARRRYEHERVRSET